MKICSDNIQRYNFTSNTQWNSQFVWYGVVIPIISIFGFCGNILLFVTMCTSRTWKTLKIYMLTISGIDIILLISVTLLYTLNAWFDHGSFRVSYNTRNNYVNLQAILYTIAHFGFFSHMWATVAMTVERYLAICHTMKHRMIKPRLIVSITLTTAIVISTCFAIPRFFETYTDYCYDRVHDIEVASNHITKMMASNTYHIWYRVIGSTVFVTIGPFVVLLVLTMSMLYQLHHRQRFLHEPAAAQKETRDKQSKRTLLRLRSEQPRETIELTGIAKITQAIVEAPERVRNVKRNQIEMKKHENTAHRPLLVVLVSALVCYSLPSVLDVIQLILVSTNNKLSFTNHLIDVSNCLVVLHASIAFYVYVLCNRTFRGQVRVKILCGIGRQSTDNLINRNNVRI